MLISKLFFPVLREVSADAKLKSHQIMLKAGMIRQSAAVFIHGCHWDLKF